MPLLLTAHYWFSMILNSIILSFEFVCFIWDEGEEVQEMGGGGIFGCLYFLPHTIGFHWFFNAVFQSFLHSKRLSRNSLYHQLRVLIRDHVKFSSELLHFSSFENLTICFFQNKKIHFLEFSEVQKSTRNFSDGLYFEV